jgi:2-dehydro-3-deoxygluconokinase
MRVVSIGECMVELRHAGDGLYARSFAGDAYNTAVYLKRSAPQAQVSLLTATGVGGLSASLRAAWADEGVQDDLAYAVEGAEPGLYMIELTPTGERSFRYWRSASPAKQWLSRLLADGGANRLAGADLVYLSGVSLAILAPDERAQAVKLLKSLKGRVGRIAFDPNVRPALWSNLAEARAAIEPVLGVADILRASREDGELLFGLTQPTAQIDAYRDLGAREIALTLDADGCVWADSANASALPTPDTGAVRDTSGAGDSFNGAYLAARLTGASGLDAARAGLAVASRVVTHAGAIVPASVSHPPPATYLSTS